MQIILTELTEVLKYGRVHDAEAELYPYFCSAGRIDNIHASVTKVWRAIIGRIL